MIKISNIQIIDTEINILSIYDYSEEMMFSFDIENEDGTITKCTSNGYSIKSDNCKYIKSSDYINWKQQIVDYINEHNRRLITNTLDDVDLQYTILDVNDDYAYTYEKYINGKLISSGIGWYKDLKYDIEKIAWKSAVKKFKKAEHIKKRTDAIQEAKECILSYIQSIEDNFDKTLSLEPPLLPSALEKLNSDPCNFINDVLEKGEKCITGISAKEIANYYVKVLKYNICVEINNKINNQIDIIESAVESVFDKIEESLEYFDDIDVMFEELYKKYSSTIALIKYVLYSPNDDEDSNVSTPSNYTYNNEASSIVYKETNKLWNLIKEDLGENPTKEKVDTSIIQFKVKIRDIHGQEKYKDIMFHKYGKSTIEAIFNEIYEKTDFKITNVYSYCYKKINNDGLLSNHSFGSAIDINPEYNPWKNPKSTTQAHPNCKNYDNDLEIRSKNHPVVQIFKKYGFGWGGFYKSGPDYMHFSCNVAIDKKGDYIGK